MCREQFSVEMWTDWVYNCAGWIWWHICSERAAEEAELQIVWLVSEKHISRTFHSWRCNCIRRSEHFFCIQDFWYKLIVVSLTTFTSTLVHHCYYYSTFVISVNKHKIWSTRLLFRVSLCWPWASLKRKPLPYLFKPKFHESSFLVASL